MATQNRPASKIRRVCLSTPSSRMMGRPRRRSIGPPYTRKTEKICDEATNEKDCGRIDYRLDESACFDDCGYHCAWMEFIEVSEKDGDKCVFGAQKGFCVFQVMGGNNPYPWWQDIPGCGRVAFQPSFVEEEGTIFVGQPERLGEAPDVKVQPCSFNAQGGTPAECDCLCDRPSESRFECDWIKGICLDTYTELYWASRLDGTVAAGPIAAQAACENLEFAGFDDWRLPALEELSTVVRGCPQGESKSSCPITSQCSSLDCADASCSYCTSSGQPEGAICPGPDCPNLDCKGCVAFGEGACASCEHLKGPGYKGCYRAANLDWACTTFWSSTKGDDLGPDGQPRYWGIDFARGGRFLSSWWVETKDGGSTLENSPFACVRP